MTSCPCGYLQGYFCHMWVCGVKMRRRWIAIMSLVLVTAAVAGQPRSPVAAAGAFHMPGEGLLSGKTVLEEEEELLRDYQDYRSRLNRVTDRSDIEENGFRIVKDQIFPMETKCFGRVEFIPAIEERYHRLVFFFADEDGAVADYTDQMEANVRNTGALKQPVKGISAVGFQDLNGDGLTDIVFIARCVNKEGAYADREYRIGDILFQNEAGFYRDYRISDKINRFGMNRSVESIIAFVRDGQSTEFLYTAATEEELVDNGFVIAAEQCYPRLFEKLGRLSVVPGSYTMANYATFMIYLVNEEGTIVWSFQPMGDYDNLYALKGIACRDIDGDGMKDILVLARYSTVGDDNIPVIESDYSIYYQRTGGFYADTRVKESVSCSDKDTVAELVERARAYWGWRSAQ